ncbi:hypothetical protein PAL_GLEAN10012607 [Pteropus alecto]|uniref:Uncharacterized protein n=1 Tax=Pteropus alecto TaxID=9402 RepID=L5K7I9_PTEAL|nr:hypothetical protein PAL_GLEAN10012607 [Pteropus alecto]
MTSGRLCSLGSGASAASLRLMDCELDSRARLVSALRTGPDMMPGSPSIPMGEADHKAAQPELPGASPERVPAMCRLQVPRGTARDVQMSLWSLKREAAGSKATPKG